MVHGVCGLSDSLYNPCPMGKVYCCTTHGVWENNIIRCVVQPMQHGVDTDCTIHGPWGVYTTMQSMLHEKIYCCMAHDAWEMNIVRCVVQPMVHGKSIFWMYCTTHELWDRHTIVQSMGHGVHALSKPLCNPYAMGQLYCCTIHLPWGKQTVAQPV